MGVEHHHQQQGLDAFVSQPFKVFLWAEVGKGQNTESHLRGSGGERKKRNALCCPWCAVCSAVHAIGNKTRDSPALTYPSFLHAPKLFYIAISSTGEEAICTATDCPLSTTYDSLSLSLSLSLFFGTTLVPPLSPAGLCLGRSCTNVSLSLSLSLSLPALLLPANGPTVGRRPVSMQMSVRSVRPLTDCCH